ncbi:MAG: DUF1223 domain-containing protein [Acetobacteraceae bacterium]
MRRRALLAASLGIAVGGAVRADASPVVLELFTSQGCSSCPPADALLGQLSARSDVIALAWHVDYWNRLGWPDPFASQAWTDRQRAYARALRQDVYTPALVVNGSAMVVGSSTRLVSAAMQAATPLSVPVRMHPTRDAVAIEIGPVTGAAVALMVTYDAAQVTAVRGGENGGRRLREYRVVRSVRPLNPFAGTVSAPLPGTGQGVALLVQDSAWRVIGAADLRPPA